MMPWDKVKEAVCTQAQMNSAEKPLLSETVSIDLALYMTIPTNTGIVRFAENMLQRFFCKENQDCFIHPSAKICAGLIMVVLNTLVTKSA